MSMLQHNPFGDRELFDMMWNCCAGTHASSVWQNNGNDYYAPAGTLCVAPISGRVVSAGVPPIGQGARIGIEGNNGYSSYSAHMKNLRVGVGDRVTAGEPIGVVWDFARHQGIPDHLHFSMARGPYRGGSFRNPWDHVKALSVHVNGRTYRSAGGGAKPGPAPPVDMTPYYAEEVPWNGQPGHPGYGPRVLGPWSNIDNRDRELESMRENGRLATPMGREEVGYYIYDWNPENRAYRRYNTEGHRYRFGGWRTDTQQDAAVDALTADGRLIWPRKFKGRANSYYPFL